jgi:hypothetical protein
MAAISYVYTISHVAKMLNVNEEWLEDVCTEMAPEDGASAATGESKMRLRRLHRSPSKLSSTLLRCTRPIPDFCAHIRQPSNRAAALTGC